MKALHTKLIDPAELTAWVTSCVAIGLHVSGHLPLGGEVLGGVITAAILPAAMIGIRLLARVIGQIPDDTVGAVGVAMLGVVACLALLLMMIVEGCGTTYTVERGGWRLESMPNGSACLHVHGDGHDITRVCIRDPEPLRLPAATVARICAAP